MTPVEENPAKPGPVLIGIEGVELTVRERDWLQHPLVGAVP